MDVMGTTGGRLEAERTTLRRVLSETLGADEAEIVTAMAAGLDATLGALYRDTSAMRLVGEILRGYADAIDQHAAEIDAAKRASHGT